MATRDRAGEEVVEAAEAATVIADVVVDAVVNVTAA
jgi:hypothetical protein